MVNDLYQLIDQLADAPPSEVEIRRFIVGCCRMVWSRLNDELKQAVVVGQDFCDGKVTLSELREVNDRVGEISELAINTDMESPSHCVFNATYFRASVDELEDACNALLAADVEAGIVLAALRTFALNQG